MENIIVRIHRPDLSPEEYARRMKEIKKAATELLKAEILLKRGGKK